MIKELKNMLSDEAIETILSIIIQQYIKYNNLTNSKPFKELFLDEYKPHNGQFSVSWAISSGFSSGSVCAGMQIECFKYSKGFTRPLLYSDNLKIMILNKTTHFDAEYLKDFYSLNGKDDERGIRFCYFKFTVDHKRLTQVSLCYPDENGNAVEEVLLNRKQINMSLVA